MPWTGPWDEHDPNANFKADIALYAQADPLKTIASLATNLDVPLGSIVHYILAKWATAGSGGLLEIGPTMIHRLWAVIESAEAEATDEGRLKAYEQLRQMISWLRLPLVDEAGYPDQGPLG